MRYLTDIHQTAYPSASYLDPGLNNSNIKKTFLGQLGNMKHNWASDDTGITKFTGSPLSVRYTETGEIIMSNICLKYINKTDK